MDRISLTELDVERFLEKYLRDQGIKNIQRQVRSEVGIADIVTPTVIYEVKVFLYPHVIRQAIGQLLYYQKFINPQACMCVAGCVPDGYDDRIETLNNYINQMNSMARIFNVGILFMHQDCVIEWLHKYLHEQEVQYMRTEITSHEKHNSITWQLAKWYIVHGEWINNTPEHYIKRAEKMIPCAQQWFKDLKEKRS